MIIFTTNLGNIEIELDFERAPVSAKNFLKYCQDGFYDGTIFHRVISGFMVQGGGFTAEMDEKPTRAAIVNEANKGLKNVIGTLAMARTDAPHSATGQFFINLANNTFLDHTATTNTGWGYAVFGKVSAGMEVINKIAKVKTISVMGHDDVPQEMIIVEKVSVF
ncbi:peptidyl-prolyl cis-trans isomerase [Shewanella sp. D64]|uniref:peptidylprolyl isomerase n=1 Tax=unclassified Shewanella TaxID=196818 RepID=UPI0022BA6597|nr:MULTISPECIES: peptidylprolyl isomerase [unclassified Shewanella]MEC4725589.1 peptidyl-prolyl cis-trans isomerase [Shewanella sp. D64]MEC4739641.1 peptidyl-prolyl cis-trans isomerase [Shewanella sp. E94]WBJ94892.1 peptidyl-prolyl cis-trans isomerase [Shewanella sp. MTB7]